MNKPVRTIAFYLPQFHPIPENDRWWGKGFTEWTNVSKARPLFEGHYQPHLPADLGFYDLRVPEARDQQVQLANEHGIDAFCYYHYWFSGQQLLDRPFNEVLATGKPDFPFCVCWANESWRRNWDGWSGDILIEQTHSREDDLQHIHWLCQVFEDRRYVRIDDKPLILIYRASAISNITGMIRVWRDEARRHGFPGLYVCRVESLCEEREDCRTLGCDAAVEFQPDWAITRHLRCRRQKRISTFAKLRRLLARKVRSTEWDSPFLVPYGRLVDAALGKPTPAYVRHPCVTPMWDNTPRKGLDGLVLTDSTPEMFRCWLAETVRRVLSSAPPHLLFINAWNEWAEGAHLEPCAKWGHSYLDVCRNVLRTRS